MRIPYIYLRVYAAYVTLHLVIILYVKWNLQIHPSFLTTMVCNFAVIVLFCSGRTTHRTNCRMNIPISSWIVFVGKSLFSINYMVRSHWVARKIKYSALIWKRIITIMPSRDSIPFLGFNQCDKSNTLRLLIRSRSQISIVRSNSFFIFENFENDT